MSTERYKNGIIYKLVCNDTSIKENYIGSCCNFYRRKTAHKGNINNINSKEYNNYKYKFIREHGGFENWSMIVIKEFPCNSKRELETEERVQLEINGGELNTNRPFITDEEKKEQKKKDDKKYNQKNKEKVTQDKKEYYEKNKEKLTAHYNKKHDCVCGGKYTNRNKARHLKSQKHTNYLND